MDLASSFGPQTPAGDIRAKPSLGPEGMDAAATFAAEKSITINCSPLHTLGRKGFFSFISGAESVITGWAIITVSAQGNGCWLGIISYLGVGSRSAKVAQSTLGLAASFFFLFWASGVRRGGKEGYLLAKWHEPQIKTSWQDLSGVLVVCTPSGRQKSRINEEDRLLSQELEYGEYL